MLRVVRSRRLGTGAERGGLGVRNGSGKGRVETVATRTCGRILLLRRVLLLWGWVLLRGRVLLWGRVLLLRRVLLLSRLLPLAGRNGGVPVLLDARVQWKMK